MVNDTIILLTLFVFFIGMGVLLPFVQEDFGVRQVEGQLDPVMEDIRDGASSPSAISILSILLSIAKMFFWTFGQIPFLIDTLVMTPLRLTFIFLIARNIWVGGGG